MARFIVALTAALGVTISACSIQPHSQPVRSAARTPAKLDTPAAGPVVLASHYGRNDGFAGKKTASGEKLDPNQLTAAHKTLPFGSKVKVTSPDSGKTVTVRINDRGPFVKGRSLDLSAAAAQKLGITDKGVAKVKIEKIQ